MIPLEVLATSTIVYRQEFPNTCVRVNLQTNSLVLLVILSNLAIQKLANTNPFILFVEASPAQTPKTESYIHRPIHINKLASREEPGRDLVTQGGVFLIKKDRFLILKICIIHSDKQGVMTLVEV